MLKKQSEDLLIILADIATNLVTENKELNDQLEEITGKPIKRPSKDEDEGDSDEKPDKEPKDKKGKKSKDEKPEKSKDKKKGKKDKKSEKKDKKSDKPEDSEGSSDKVDELEEIRKVLRDTRTGIRKASEKAGNDKKKTDKLIDKFRDEWASYLEKNEWEKIQAIDKKHLSGALEDCKEIAAKILKKAKK